jgi:pseudouridine-5'-phosphate glycosidase
LPGFYTAHSGIPLAASVDDPSQVVSIARAHFGLGRKQSVLVVQSPPANVALDADVIDAAVQSALGRAQREGIRGAAVTPYLLEAVARETGGRSLETNLALLEANAGLAGQIAVAMKAE